MKDTPRLTIGLPIYNGEQFIRDAIDSILDQTYHDFELILSDNASTDCTSEICRQYAAKDNRVRYYRNEQNLGAARNYNLVFELSGGTYFKWAAHDDVLAPEFLQKCIAILDQDESVVLCHTKAAKIDDLGQRVGSYESKMNFVQSTPYERFHDLVLVPHPCTAVFGIARREVLSKSSLIGNYVGSDRNLLAELGLVGRIYEIPEYLFFRRDHTQSSISKFNEYERLVWFDPVKGRGVHFPTWRRGFEYLRSVTKAALDWQEKLKCYRLVVFWFKGTRKMLAEDIIVAADHLMPSLKRQAAKDL